MSCRPAGLLGLAILAVLLAGCATPQTDSLLADRPPVKTQTVYIAAPFVAQRTDECGPASMAMALRWLGTHVSIDRLVEEIYTPGRHGSLQSAMVAAARRNGTIPYPVRTLRALAKQLADGQPMIVLQNLGLSWFPQWHYALAIGYDLEREKIVLHSGATAGERLDMALFERTWARSDYWAIAVTSPDRLPAGAARKIWLTEAAGLERAGQNDAARRAYLTALTTWPEDHLALMGLGNASYALGRKADAASAYRRAAVADKTSDVARNNLAHVLAELGRLDEAERVAREAVALNGHFREAASKTLAEIEAKRRRRP